MPIDDEIALNNVRATIEKLRQDLADTERDIAFQEMRAEIIRDTLEMLCGKAPAEPRQRQTRKRRGEASPPSTGYPPGHVEILAEATFPPKGETVRAS